MIARGTGAFLVTLVVIGYFYGDFYSDRALLIAVLVAAAVGALVALWLRPGHRGPTENGVFDERQTRRAVRRGVMRTAFVAVVWVFFGALILQWGSAFWQDRGDRREHYADVAGYGFFAAHPGFRWTGPAFCCNTDMRSMAALIELEPKLASPVPQSESLWLHITLRGRLEHAPIDNDLPKTGIDGVGYSTRTRAAGLFRSLPSTVVATAVVELRRPLEVSAFYALLARHRMGDVAVYLQPRIPQSAEGVYADKRVSWPKPALAGFQAWVKRLRRSDGPLLDDLGLPSVQTLRSLAEQPRIYGFVLDRAHPRLLRAVLGDLDVQQVEVGDISFNLA